MTMGATNKVFAQKMGEVDFKYKIFIKTGGDKVKLNCAEGCAWKELTFNLDENVPQFIDETGMVKDGELDNKNMAKFIFSIRRSEDFLYFESLKESRWKSLDLNCSPVNCSHEIDQNGIVPPKLQ